MVDHAPVTILAREVTTVPIDALSPHPQNPRRGNVEAIRESIRHNGFVAPILVQASRMRIIAGEHRWRAAVAEGYDEVPVVLLDIDDSHALRVLLADNKTADDAAYDEPALIEALQAAADANAGLLLGTGWATVELEALLEAAGEGQRGSFRDALDDGEDGPAADDDDENADDRGTLLALTDVTVGEPTHQVDRGDVYRLDGRHLLVVDDVMTGWRSWVRFLVEGCVFVPYPGVYLVFGLKAAQQVFVMVQPNGYLAGHLLDKWAAVHSETTIEKITPA